MTRWKDFLEQKPSQDHQTRVFNAVDSELAKNRAAAPATDTAWLRRLILIAPLAAAALAIWLPRWIQRKQEDTAPEMAQLEWLELLDETALSDEDLAQLEDLEIIEELEILEKWTDS